MKDAPASILVVDDEETTRRTLGDILHLEGYEVQLAAGGAEACTLVLGSPSNTSPNTLTNRFDLLILDLKMPGMDGIEVMHILHSAEAYYKANVGNITSLNNFPDVILLTAHGSMESAIAALRQGALDYLLKPCSPQDMLNSVAKCLRQRKDKLYQADLVEQAKATQPEPDLSGILNSQSPKGISGEGVMKDPTILLMYENLELNLSKRELSLYSKRVRLTISECKLMQIIFTHPGQLFTYKELVKIVQGYNVDPWEAVDILRPLVSRLRQKLARLDPPPSNTDYKSKPQDSIQEWIVNVRATGYVFEKPHNQLAENR